MRSIGADRYSISHSEHHHLATNSAYIVSRERAQLLHSMQPNQFYVLEKNASDKWFGTRCLYQQESAVCDVRPFNVLHRRFGEAGLLGQWRRRVHDTLDMAVRANRVGVTDDAVMSSDERSWLDRCAWMGGVLAIGWSAAGAALVVEWVVLRRRKRRVS